MEATETKPVLSWSKPVPSYFLGKHTIRYARKKYYKFSISINEETLETYLYITHEIKKDFKVISRECRCLEDAKAKAELFILKQIKK